MFQNNEILNRIFDVFDRFADRKSDWIVKENKGMLDWKRVEEELPAIGDDVLAMNINNGKSEFGFRSEVDNDISDWVDFDFEVTHWAYANLPEDCYSYDEDGWPVGYMEGEE